MRNKLTYLLVAAGFAALIFLNPSQDQHRRAFMDYAHAHFFELPAGYREIYEQLRAENLHYNTSDALRYGNFLLFSTVSHTKLLRMQNKQFRPERRPLTFGALGFVWPIIIEPSAGEQPSIDQ